MIDVKNTPNNAGVAIYGDYQDFTELYDALHIVVGQENEYISYEPVRLRVLGLCYDIRHALMGDREIEFVDNGMDEDKMKRLSTITNNKNIYLVVNSLWPEILFVTIALNDFIRLYANKQSKKSYDMMMDKQIIWDGPIALVRLFQAAIAKAIKETVSEKSFNRMRNLMVKDYTWLGGYTTQYLDMLNCRFLDLDKEKRLKNITIMAKRLAEQGQEYQELRSEVVEAARQYNCSVKNIRLQLEYPEDIKW